MERRAEREGASNDLTMSTVRHQTSALAGRVATREGETLSGAISDETGLPRRESEGAGRNLLEQAFARENMQRAWKRVKANKGSAGVDGLDIAQPAEYLRWTWPTVRQQGRHIGVDVDLSKVFDRVNHDILIDRLRKRVNNRGVIRLVRAYLNAGIMEGGMVMDRHEGTPQGGPLSPLLANVLLDEGDRALERRGHCFARDADDCNVYVRSQKAGERVMLLLRRCYDKLRLVINEAKSAVTSGVGRKFLGYTLWQGPNGDVRRGVAAQALQAFKLRVKQLPRRSGGRSIEQGVEKLRSYLLGWKGYFKLSQTPPRIWRSLDAWIRRRLRAMQLKQWRRGKTIYRELVRMGADPWVAQSVAALSRRWWHNSLSAIHNVLTVAYFDRRGVPRLS